MAARRRTPKAKKQLDYKKQRRGFTEYTQSMRRGKWRRKKRRPAQRVERQAERIAVTTQSDDELRDPGFDAGAIARPKINKWGATSLGDWVTKQKQGRVQRTVRNRSKRR